jgi:cytochrome c peroxidase
MNRKVKLYAILILIGVMFMVAGVSISKVAAEEDGSMIALGKALFFDEHLSVNNTQSCASCHAPEVGFTSPDEKANAGGGVVPGAIPNRAGNRKPPSAAYAGFSPNLYFNEDTSRWIGGMFWDGRATGEVLGDPLAEQAQKPFLNPLEQALPNQYVLCVKALKSEYADLFYEVWGQRLIDCAINTDSVYENIARSIAAYERSVEVNPYTSKFDLFWDAAIAAGKDVTQIKCGSGGGGMMGGCMGNPSDPNNWTNYRNLGFNDTELIGLAAYNDPMKADCASCHTLQPGPDGYPLFTDFGYDNLGIPKNPENPFYDMPRKWNPDGEDWIDYGLGSYLESAGYPSDVYGTELGKFKNTTLRNVDLRPTEDFIKAYGHNGYFKSLFDIVFFYHWRGMMDGDCMGMGCPPMMGNMFPAPEVDLNRKMLAMFPRPLVEPIVAFLETLNDGYFER